MTDQQTDIVCSRYNLSKLYIAINSVLLILFICFFYNAFYELFIYIEKVHYPLIMSGQAEGYPFSFSFNVPTVCNLIILLTSGVCIFSSIKFFFNKKTISNCNPVRFWVIRITGVIICLVCEAVIINDFFSNAFDGVG